MKAKIERKYPKTRKELELLANGDIVYVDFGNMLERSKIGTLAMVEGQEQNDIGFIGRYNLKKIFYITIPKDYFCFNQEGISVTDHIGYYRRIVGEGEKINFFDKKLLNYDELKLKLEKGGIWEGFRKR